jgi:hypothetical protein
MLLIAGGGSYLPQAQSCGPTPRRLANDAGDRVRLGEIAMLQVLSCFDVKLNSASRLASSV